MSDYFYSIGMLLFECKRDWVELTKKIVEDLSNEDNQ